MIHKRPVLLALSLLCIFLLIHYTFHPNSTSSQQQQQPSPPSTPSPLPSANSTLGFGTILAISPPSSPRLPSLLWAANLTSLSLTVPPQPAWTDTDITNLRAKNSSSVLSKGSALAWLAHLHALRYFLSDTAHETALIIEDDTDFSLLIRQTQIPLLATAVRRLLSNSSAPIAPNDPAYWSHTLSWDLLYPGHCDDLLSPHTYLTHPFLAYSDNSAPPLVALHPDTSLFLASLALPSHTRILHRAFWPFCTFAYAVTRRSAALILSQLDHESDTGTSAFDVALLGACRDRGWGCWSVSPEVFHHGHGESEIGRVDSGGAEKMEGRRKKVERGTWNIACGARDAGLWVGEEDVEGRAEVKDLVGGMIARGECAVDSSVAEKTWRGCEWGECGAQS